MFHVSIDFYIIERTRRPKNITNGARVTSLQCGIYFVNFVPRALGRTFKISFVSFLSSQLWGYTYTPVYTHVRPWLYATERKTERAVRYIVTTNLLFFFCPFWVGEDGWVLNVLSSDTHGSYIYAWIHKPDIVSVFFTYCKTTGWFRNVPKLKREKIPKQF